VVGDFGGRGCSGETEREERVVDSRRVEVEGFAKLQP